MNDFLFDIHDELIRPYGTERTQIVYVYSMDNGNKIMWDIDKAWRILKNKPRKPHIVEDQNGQFKHIAETFDLEPEKLKHADCAVPGIITTIIQDNKLQNIVIDGIHRLVKAYQNDFTYFCYYLFPEESKECIIACTDISLLP